MKRFLLALLFVLSLTAFQQSNAQYIKPKGPFFNLGVGTGLTYGGLGGKFTISPIENLSYFIGLGYNLVGAGYNVGAMYSIPSDSKVQAYFNAMYGYNAAIKIIGASRYDKTYYGFSMGGGIKLRPSSMNGNYWEFGLIVPFKSSEYDEDWSAVKNDPNIEDLVDPLPILINVGYNFRI